MRNHVTCLVAVGALAAIAQPASAQGTVAWKVGFPAFNNAPAGQNMGSMDVQGTYTVAQGWSIVSIAVMYIPNPVPVGGAPPQGTEVELVAAFGGWGKTNRAVPGGPVIGVLPKQIPLATGKYQVWVSAMFVQNPPPGGWPGNVAPPTAYANKITNFTNIEIKAAMAE